MSDFPLISPLLDGMVSEESIPEGSGVFRVRHEASGRSLMVKRISIPESPADTEALLLTGAVKDREGANAYYLTVANQYRDELKRLRDLSSGPYFCSYLRFQAVPKQDAPGLDLYLLAPCRTSLKEYLHANAITQQKALQLALDLCHALAILRRSGYLHQDLKPENVFLENGRFCIGDFGLVSTTELRYASLPARLIGRFTPPELHSVTATLNETIDLYAVGMMLYYIFNGNHAPFEEAETTEQMADDRRLAGEPLPTPLYADYELDAIIQKACAFQPENRYQTPEAFLSALQAYLDRNHVKEESIVPPLCTDDLPDAPAVEDAPEQEPETSDAPASLNAAQPEKPAQEEAPAPQPAAVSDETRRAPAIPSGTAELSDDFRENFAPARPAAAKKKKKRRWIPITLLILIVLGAAVGYFYFFYSAISVSAITVTDKGPDYLTVSVSASDIQNLMVTCATEDGSYSKTYYCEESLTFYELQPGTTYQLIVDSIDWHHVRGMQSELAATAAMTEVLNLTAEEQADGTVLVSFQVSGPEPQTWTLHYKSDMSDEATVEVTDHTATIPELLPNSTYTLTLEADDSVYLGGTTEITYTYTLPITGSNLRLEALAPTAISVIWDSDSDVSTQWEAVCSGDNGYANTLIVDSCRAVFENTSVGATYTIAVSNSTMSMPMHLTVQSAMCTVTAFSAEEAEGVTTLSWSTDGDMAPESWTIYYRPTGTELTPQAATATGSSATIEDLLPGTDYTFALSASGDILIDGSTETTLTTADAAAYTEHDFDGIALTLHDKPDGDWSVASLGDAKTAFSAGQAIVCAMRPTAAPRTQEEPETVNVLLAVRSEDGTPCTILSQSISWNDLWDENVYAAAIDALPESAGSYTVTLYFNRQLIGSTELTIA